VSVVVRRGRVAALARLYFPCRVRLNGADAFLLWYEDERDGFARTPDGRLLVGASLDALATSAAGLGVEWGEAYTDYDFDRVRAWCRRPTSEGFECRAFLDAWNFFDDLAGLRTAPSSEYARVSEAATACYDKLFWGSNLPSVTPPGERFDPTWSAKELEAVRRVFEAGLAYLEAELAGENEDREPSAAADVGGRQGTSDSAAPCPPTAQS
jgi:hypothetical protein